MRDWNPKSCCSAFLSGVFWIEPMRDWNVIKVNERWVRQSCFESNLWGIEISDMLQNLSSRGACFESNLWGIEISMIWTSWNPMREFWIEPMRDWNARKYCWLIDPQKGFESNLWGIEIRLRRRENLRGLVLNRTYEGLKSARNSDLVAYARRVLNRTYEGLKFALWQTN